MSMSVAAEKSSTTLLKEADLAVFFSQMAMIMGSGIPVSEGLHAFSVDFAAEPIGAQAKIMLEATETRALSLHGAMEETGVFPDYAREMVRVGEEAGRLEEVLRGLGDFYQRRYEMNRQIFDAFLYPSILMVMMLIVIGVLVVRVLPVFEQVLAQLSGISNAADGFVNPVSGPMAMTRVALPIVGVIVAVAIVVIFFLLSERGRRMADDWLQGFFLTRSFMFKNAVARFSSAMALVLASGLSTDLALELASQVAGNKRLQEIIGDCRREIEQSGSFVNTLADSGIYASTYSNMLKAGGKTGGLDEVMSYIARQCERETEDQIARVVSLVEPSLVALLSLVVGGILISVMLPLTEIMRGMS